MSVLRKRGRYDPISIEDADDPRYDGEAGTGPSLAGRRRALGQQGSGV